MCQAELRQAYPRGEADSAALPLHLLQADDMHCRPDHNASIHIPKICQDNQANYEEKFCLIIGCDAKNVLFAETFNCVAAYIYGNDISSRKLQQDLEFAD